ncbi:MAG: hypothetical protein AAF497_23785, partial [Planctomycetota bacterium]
MRFTSSDSTTRRFFLLVSLVLMVGLTSCKGKVNPQLYADTSEAFNKGIEAYDNGDFPAATEALTAAIDGYGLTPDQYSKAIVRRAVAFARQGKYAEAHKDLDDAERGAPNMDEVYQARHF